MKALRYIVSTLLILNLSGAVLALELCSCPEMRHVESHCGSAMEGHKTAHSGSDKTSVSAHSSRSALTMQGFLRQTFQPFCCQMFETNKEQANRLSVLMFKGTVSSTFKMDVGLQTKVSFGSFKTGEFFSTFILSNFYPVTRHIYLFNSSLLI